MLYFAGSLLCPETDWKIHVGKQGYVFILTDFKKRLMFHSWHQLGSFSNGDGNGEDDAF